MDLFRFLGENVTAVKLQRMESKLKSVPQSHATLPSFVFFFLSQKEIFESIMR